MTLRVLRGFAFMCDRSAFAENRWAVIISGASGGEKYAEQMATWRNDLRAALVDRYQFKPEFVKMFVDETATSGDKGSAGERPQGSSPT